MLNPRHHKNAKTEEKRKKQGEAQPRNACQRTSFKAHRLLDWELTAGPCANVQAPLQEAVWERSALRACAELE